MNTRTSFHLTCHAQLPRLNAPFCRWGVLEVRDLKKNLQVLTSSLRKRYFEGPAGSTPFHCEAKAHRPQRRSHRAAGSFHPRTSCQERITTLRKCSSSSGGPDRFLPTGCFAGPTLLAAKWHKWSHNANTPCTLVVNPAKDARLKHS